ncbi:MAG: hypothetical protein LBK23_12070, partial [Oscillospiraceae bacterium]|jgi:hypothetical protein|nr:hypothetical protein [Oscillospiraceae bacterium]
LFAALGEVDERFIEEAARLESHGALQYRASPERIAYLGRSVAAAAALVICAVYAIIMTLYPRERNAPEYTGSDVGYVTNYAADSAESSVEEAPPAVPTPILPGLIINETGSGANEDDTAAGGGKIVMTSDIYGVSVTAFKTASGDGTALYFAEFEANGAFYRIELYDDENTDAGARRLTELVAAAIAA